MCKTNGGEESNSACVFPFRYYEMEYNQCTTVNRTARWCSTKVDSSGKHIGRQGNYGTCGPGCPKDGTY